MARRPVRHRARRHHPHKGHPMSKATRRKLSLERRGHKHPHKGHHLKRRLHRRLRGRKVKVVTRKGRTAKHHRLSVRKLMHLLTRHRVHAKRGLHGHRRRRVRLLRRPRAIPVSKG